MIREHHILPFGSAEQLASIELRDLVLRKPLGMQFTKEQLAAEKDQIHIGQYIDGNMSACLVMKLIENNIAKMRQVAVHPKLQGKGCGKKLVQFSEEEMLRRGYKKIELHARDTAVSFYKNIGYHIVGEPFLEIGIEHFKMVKQLNQ